MHTHTGVPEQLSWENYVKTAPEGMRPILDIPEDAAPPLAVSPTHPRAVGTYGPKAVEWMESNLLERGRPLRLRWWQKFAIWRQLECDKDGKLVWMFDVESTSRRSGKSTRLRGVALWRLQHGPELFEDEQIIMHTGRDLAICREIIRKAHAHAALTPGWDAKKGMTEPEVSYKVVNRWVVRSKDSTTGYDTCMALVDEAWDVPASAVDEDLEPSMLERESPQILLTSTAHRRATSLMRGRMKDVLAGDEDGKTLLLWWGAPLGADYSDPAVWRAASPYWSPAREEMIAAKYGKAARGEQDKEFDDPDPMAGFAAQYLNAADVWLAGSEKPLPGDPVTTRDDWSTLGTTAPDRLPDSVAVESWFEQGVSVALAWNLQDGSPVIVSVTDHADLPAAVKYVATLGYKKPVLAGTSLTDHATWKENGVRFTKMAAATRTQVGELMRQLGESAFRHDGGSVLADQVLAMRTSPSSDGITLRSKGRADAIKAATWAVTEARAVKPTPVDAVDTVIYV